jgi:hypothetical protein
LAEIYQSLRKNRKDVQLLSQHTKRQQEFVGRYTLAENVLRLRQRTGTAEEAISMLLLLEFLNKILEKKSFTT